MRKLGISTLLLPILLAGVSAQPACAGEFDSYFGETYVQRESGPLKADIYVPKGEGPFPGVLVVHGGAWYMGTRAQLSGFAQLLASRGLTAVAISYRFAPKFKFPAQIEDCKDAVRWMRQRADQFKIDPERIGGFGYSAGAQLAALLGTTGIDRDSGRQEHGMVNVGTRLLAVAGGGAPCDFRTLPLDLEMLSFWLGGTRRQKGDQYRLASPAAFVSEDDPPMFFFHGENDKLVPIESPMAMCEHLKDVGVQAELYTVPNADHIFAMLDPKALDKCATFLIENLKAGGEMP